MECYTIRVERSFQLAEWTILTLVQNITPLLCMPFINRFAYAAWCSEKKKLIIICKHNSIANMIHLLNVTINKNRFFYCDNKFNAMFCCFFFHLKIIRYSNELLGLEGMVKIKNPDENLLNGNHTIAIGDSDIKISTNDITDSKRFALFCVASNRQFEMSTVCNNFLLLLSFHVFFFRCIDR